jgi:hypothetical protein
LAGKTLIQSRGSYRGGKMKVPEAAAAFGGAFVF